ncbi:hypothetical protein PQQ73_37690, partial [Paraburkholderia strydomiana]
MDARTDTPRHLDILGIGEPFATRWRLSLVFGLLVYVGYRPIFGAPAGDRANCGGLGWVIDPDGNVLASTSQEQPYVAVDI